jgi:PEP-CTERM motif
VLFGAGLNPGDTTVFALEAPTDLVSVTGVNNPLNTPLPAALPLFASGLGALGLLGWRRKRKVRTA